jgi:RNA 2',3'-cyclic 3'-phosphodiesterase
MRVFLAIDLPGPVRAALSVQQFLLPLPRRIAPDTFHLTLVFLGEVDPPVLDAVDDALRLIDEPAFSISLQGLGLFGGDRPRAAWAGVAPSVPLARLQSRLERAARRAGSRVDHRHFIPHVTLGRFPPPSRFDAMRLEHAVVAGNSFETAPFDVSKVVLYRSTLHPKGARYDILTEYPLSQSGDWAD